MKNPNEVTREYSKPDQLMLGQGQNFCDNLKKHIDDFKTKYPFMDLDYVSIFQEAINDASATERDKEVITDISLEVSIIEGYMSKGRVAYTKAIQCAKLAYPHNPAMVNTFGRKDYEAYSTVHYLLPIILDQAFRRANNEDIKPLLIAKGLTEEDILNLRIVSDKIKEEYKVIYAEKSERFPITQDRIAKDNIVWAIMSEISMCSKDVYSDNWAMRHVFLLYPENEPVIIPPVPPVPLTE